MKTVGHFKIHHWPVLTSAWFLITFVITYLVSVLNGHVYPVFPYISDTGALPPESCIFGFLVNLGTIFIMISMGIRYLQVEISLNAEDIRLNRKLNTVSINIGMVACLGISMVANFQETSAPGIHFAGALLAFGIGTLYFYIQTIISFYYLRIGTIGVRLFYLRTFLVSWMLPLFISHVVCSLLSIKEFTGESIVWWTQKDGGFQLRLGGSITELLLVIFVFIYIVTFTNEFKSLKYNGINIVKKFNNTN